MTRLTKPENREQELAQARVVTSKEVAANSDWNKISKRILGIWKATSIFNKNELELARQDLRNEIIQIGIFFCDRIDMVCIVVKTTKFKISLFIA